MELTEFMWRGIENFEIGLVEFRSSIVWKTKFEDLISEVEGKLYENSPDNIDPTVKIDNIILNIRDSLPNNFISMKKLHYWPLKLLHQEDKYVTLEITSD
ncbi:hypothetical protein TNCV_84991 [Trichonephila clavipes]|nr:hypothetical protein TNCV_84991 [Trichonephila clavipes]